MSRDLREFERAKDAYHRRYKLLTPWVPELIAMRAGLRAMIEVPALDREELRERRRLLANFCARARFHLGERECGEHFRLYVSTRPDVDIHARSPEAAGALFGYPPCCIDAFDRLSRAGCYSPHLNHAARLLDGGAAHPFVANPFLQGSPFHLYKHFPCSLRCEPTRRAAAELLRLIERQSADLAAEIARWNAAPVLFTDVCGVGIHFDGARDGELVRYRGWYYDGDVAAMAGQPGVASTTADAALFGAIAEALATGDALALEPAGLRVLRDGRAVASFARPAQRTWALLEFRPSPG